jgi:hypothetical protein|tara:strand:+ start:30 stop:728 length:699 start_codon:yes stop_codon:yes gene_type:complete
MLPKIDLPIRELILPSTGEIIKYRPFTVKEEKILLVAQESDDAMQEITAARQVVNNCMIDKNIEDLAMFDLEYIILMLRSVSVDNEIKFQINDPDTDELIELTLDLSNVTCSRPEGHTNKLDINEEYSLFLKYPTIDEYIKIQSTAPNDPLAAYFVMTSCLDKVASEDESHNFSDYTDQDIDNFMDGISGEVVKGIQLFFETMPRMRHELKYENKDGKEQTFVMEGMKTFFI